MLRRVLERVREHLYDAASFGPLALGLLAVAGLITGVAGLATLVFFGTLADEPSHVWAAVLGAFIAGWITCFNGIQTDLIGSKGQGRFLSWTQIAFLTALLAWSAFVHATEAATLSEALARVLLTIGAAFLMLIAPWSSFQKHSQAEKEMLTTYESYLRVEACDSHGAWKCRWESSDPLGGQAALDDFDRLSRELKGTKLRLVRFRGRSHVIEGRSEA